jgi:hypothetical protein
MRLELHQYFKHQGLKYIGAVSGYTPLGALALARALFKRPIIKLN